MNIQHSDIILVGGGIAGMTAAAAFGTAGFSVALVDPSLAKQSNDLRSTAFL
ncbi:MAG: FAD-binding protein, partial [Rhodobacteraceae bacterium]|nr:FAD-binding protein [Paracoccaceae bacterium]